MPIESCIIAAHLQVSNRPIEPPPQDLKEKYRWIQCTLKNATQFDIVLTDTYFDSGRYWTAPASLGAFSQMTWSACNQDGSMFTGATGGTAFRLSLDGEHQFDISLVSSAAYYISWNGETPYR